MPRDERSLEGVTAGPVPAAIAHGELEILGLLPNSSNYTFLARARHGEEEALAVYKPRRGENPLWDFPEGTLCQREVAAYLVARALGWPQIPPTILREGPEGEGSVQRFIEFEPAEQYFTLLEKRPDDFRRVALFDIVVNNADRKAGHCLLAKDGHVFVVDHGVCFNEEPKLRTVIWDFMGEPVSSELLADLSRLRPKLEEGALRTELASLLDPAEIASTVERLDELVARAEFPEPGPGRPYPWPVV